MRRHDPGQQEAYRREMIGGIRRIGHPQARA